MIPQESLSSVAKPDTYYTPDDTDPPDALTDYEWGGVGLNDATGGLRQKIWTARANGDTGEVYISAPGIPEVVVFTAPGITELSLAFDQNMRPFVAFVQNGQAKYYWYDTVLGGTRISDLDPADRNPRCTMDDKRDFATFLGQNDIILAYVRDGFLYYRQQRDRFNTERQLYNNEAVDGRVPGRLMRVGMHRGNRLQFMFVGVPA